MRLLVFISLVVLALSACTKEDETDLIKPPKEPISRIRVEDVVGTYFMIDHRRYWWQLPPPGGSSYTIDTAISVVRSDTVPPFDQNIFYVGDLAFRLNSDSTLFAQNCSQQPGRFYMSNDTLRFVWECRTNGNYGDARHRTLVGHKL